MGKNDITIQSKANGNYPDIVPVIKNAYAVCTWSSSSATPAICEGKPLYVKSKNCFFYNMNSGDIKDIENPGIKDNRDKWFANYAATHYNLKDLNTAQYFLKEGPLAILPFSKNYFSFVWSVKKYFFEINSKKITNLVKEKIIEILKSKHNITISNIQSYPISLSLRRQYHQKNILILGEGLHTIHPVAGQGFNLVLRDIKKLKEIVKYYAGLGISIKNSYALHDFYNSRKPENTIMSLGVDATHSFFKQNKYLDPFKEIIVKNIKNNETLKKFSKIISNRGLSL